MQCKSGKLFPSHLAFVKGLEDLVKMTSRRCPSNHIIYITLSGWFLYFSPGRWGYCRPEPLASVHQTDLHTETRDEIRCHFVRLAPTKQRQLLSIFEQQNFPNINNCSKNPPRVIIRQWPRHSEPEVFSCMQLNIMCTQYSHTGKIFKQCLLCFEMIVWMMLCGFNWTI